MLQFQIDVSNYEFAVFLKYHAAEQIQKERKGFVGKLSLINQGIEFDYRTKRVGRKAWFICGSKEQRKQGEKARKDVFASRIPVVCNVIA